WARCGTGVWPARRGGARSPGSGQLAVAASLLLAACWTAAGDPGPPAGQRVEAGTRPYASGVSAAGDLASGDVAYAGRRRYPTRAPDGTLTLRFAGYTWRVAEGHSPPGPTHFHGSNVWVDEAGRLHLALVRRGGRWTGAYVAMVDDRLGFGDYTFQVSGPIGALDPNVVLGLFAYPTRDVGPDGTNEIDIEFARWGDPGNPNGWYTVWPPEPGGSKAFHAFRVPAAAGRTIHTFRRLPDAILFRSVVPSGGDVVEIGRWAFRPARPARHVPRQPMPIHINLWLRDGQPPSDGREVEVVIERFTFSPAR